MVKRKGGARARSRHLMRKPRAMRGKMSLTQFFMTYVTGESVTLIAEPAYHKGMFPLRFFGKKAIVAGKRGTCYEVTIKDGNKIKTLITHPIHMRKVVNSPTAEKVTPVAASPKVAAAPKIAKVEMAHKAAAKIEKPMTKSAAK